MSERHRNRSQSGATAAILGLLGFALAGPAAAEVQSHVATATLVIQPGGGVSRAIVELPRFQGEQGTLLAVGLQLDVRFGHRLGLENVGDQPAQVTCELLKGVRTAPLDGGAPLLVEQAVSHAHSLAAFDGVLDFAGPSGVTIREASKCKHRTARPLGEPWLASQGGPRRAFHLELLEWLGVSSSGPIEQQLELVAHVELRVDYLYEPAGVAWSGGDDEDGARGGARLREAADRPREAPGVTRAARA